MNTYHSFIALHFYKCSKRNLRKLRANSEVHHDSQCFGNWLWNQYFCRCTSSAFNSDIRRQNFVTSGAFCASHNASVNERKSTTDIRNPFVRTSQIWEANFSVLDPHYWPDFHDGVNDNRRLHMKARTSCWLWTTSRVEIKYSLLKKVIDMPKIRTASQDCRTEVCQGHIPILWQNIPTTSLRRSNVSLSEGKEFFLWKIQASLSFPISEQNE